MILVYGTTDYVNANNFCPSISITAVGACGLIVTIACQDFIRPNLPMLAKLG